MTHEYSILLNGTKFNSRYSSQTQDTQLKITAIMNNESSKMSLYPFGIQGLWGLWNFLILPYIKSQHYYQLHNSFSYI